MRDRLAARHFALGALEIDVDPLMVAGRVGEFVDLFLGDRVPVADPDLLAFIGLQIGGAFDFQHRLLPLAMRLYADGDCFASLAMTPKKKLSLRRAQRRSVPRRSARWPRAARHMPDVNNPDRRPDKPLKKSCIGNARVRSDGRRASG